jgi:hypothetical protein
MPSRVKPLGTVLLAGPAFPYERNEKFMKDADGSGQSSPASVVKRAPVGPDVVHGSVHVAGVEEGDGVHD